MVSAWGKSQVLVSIAIVLATHNTIMNQDHETRRSKIGYFVFIEQ